MSCILARRAGSSSKECGLSDSAQRLGCGEQGCAYKLSDTDVIKESPFTARFSKDQWLREACIGKELGLRGLAPKVFQFFECNSAGYIVLQKLQDATVWGPFQIRTESFVGFEDHVSKIPKDIQIQFVRIFNDMARLSYIHMDSHLKNIGYIATCEGDIVKYVRDQRVDCIKPIVFDFGFTVQRSFSEDDIPYAVAFSCFQVLEHVPKSELPKTLMYSIATKLVPDAIPRTTDEAVRMAGTGPNADIRIGCLCYRGLFQMETTDRYMSDLYSTVYQIRKGQFNQTNTWGSTEDS